MANEWFSQIESTILTIIQYELQEKLLAPYPNLKCTTKNQYTNPSEFPTLYLHMLNPLEEAQDLENDEVNAILATIEMQVFSNRSETEANKIMTKAISVCIGVLQCFPIHKQMTRFLFLLLDSENFAQN